MAGRSSRLHLFAPLVRLHYHRVRTISPTEKTVVVASAASAVLLPISAGMSRNDAGMVDSWICTLSGVLVTVVTSP